MDGRRLALIIANEEYQDPGLQRLRSPQQDAMALSDVLGDPEIGDFDVVVVRNEASHEIHVRIEDFFIDARSDDLLLLHFACHGLKSDSGELFFAATNTRPTRLGSTAVPADFVQRCMRGSRSRSVVLLLDCCYGGAFPQGATVRAAGSVAAMDSFPAQRLGRGRAVITASNAMEYAFEGDHLADELGGSRPSVFTGALVEGLTTGDADRDEDGLISLDDLYDYLFQRVTELNPAQTPQRNFELEGEVYLAKSHRRRIKPTPLPGDLADAIAHTSPWARIGAVTELRARLASDNLGVAKAAHEALQQIAAHDIQQVAAAAQSALAGAVLTPSTTRVSLGELTQGTSSPERPVRLLGPPIARIANAHAAHDWLKIRQAADAFHLSADTSTTGSHTTELIIEGPAGSATVEVDAQIIARPTATQPAATPTAGATPAHPATHEPSRPPSPPRPAAPARDQPAPATASPGPSALAQSPVEAPGPRQTPPSTAPIGRVPEWPGWADPTRPTARASRERAAGSTPGMGPRFLAWLIDSLLPAFAAFLVLGANTDSTGATSAAGIWAFLLICAVMVANIVGLTALTGATVGMRMTKIQVVNLQDGTVPGWRSAINRFLICFIGWFPGVGIGRLWLALSPRSESGRRQSRADKAAGTLIVWRPQAARPPRPRLPG